MSTTNLNFTDPLKEDQSTFQYESEGQELIASHSSHLQELSPLIDQNHICPDPKTIAEYGSQVTLEELLEADNERALVYQGLAEAIISCSNHYTISKREVAGRLAKVLYDKGKLIGLAFDEQSEIISSLVHELQNNFSDELDQLSLAEWVGELEARNIIFNVLKKSFFQPKPSVSQKE